MHVMVCDDERAKRWFAAGFLWPPGSTEAIGYIISNARRKVHPGEASLRRACTILLIIRRERRIAHSALGVSYVREKHIDDLVSVSSPTKRVRSEPTMEEVCKVLCPQ